MIDVVMAMKMKIQDGDTYGDQDEGGDESVEGKDKSSFINMEQYIHISQSLASY